MPPACGDAAAVGGFAAGAGAMAAAAPATASAEQITRRRPRPLMPQLSAPRVAPDVGGELGSARVLALLDVDRLPPRVVEDRGREPDRRLEVAGDLLVGIAVARIGDGQLTQEGMRGGGGVVGVHAEEGNPLAELRREILEPGKLLAAGPAPRRPLVDHHRVA